MDYEKLKNDLVDAVQDQEGGLVKITALLDTIKADYESFQTAAKKVEDLEKKVADLRDSNLKLFLSQTGRGHEEEVEKTGIDAVDEYWDTVFVGGDD